MDRASLNLWIDIEKTIKPHLADKYCDQFSKGHEELNLLLDSTSLEFLVERELKRKKNSLNIVCNGLNIYQLRY